MPDQSPAEELRAAASLMRRRAEAATTGPWAAGITEYDGEPFGFVTADVSQAHDPATWIMGTGRRGPGGVSAEADAEHIASWSPPPVLAVADWLETEAHMADRRGNSVEGQTFHALAVARAYLGTEKDARKLKAVPGE